jgi:hypothetical protein
VEGAKHTTEKGEPPAPPLSPPLLVRPLVEGLLPSLLHLRPSRRTPSTSSEHFLVRWVGSPGGSARCRADRDHARRFYFRNSTGTEDREKSSHTGRVWYLGDVAISDVGSTTRSTHLRAELNKTSRRSATRTEQGQVPHGFGTGFGRLHRQLLCGRVIPATGLRGYVSPHMTVTVLLHIDLG